MRADDFLSGYYQHGHGCSTTLKCAFVMTPSQMFWELSVYFGCNSDEVDYDQDSCRMQLVSNTKAKLS